jgi:hypothetical protein
MTKISLQDTMAMIWDRKLLYSRPTAFKPAMYGWSTPFQISDLRFKKKIACLLLSYLQCYHKGKSHVFKTGIICRTREIRKMLCGQWDKNSGNSNGLLRCKNSNKM